MVRKYHTLMKSPNDDLITYMAVKQYEKPSSGEEWHFMESVTTADTDSFSWISGLNESWVNSQTQSHLPHPDD